MPLNINAPTFFSVLSPNFTQLQAHEYIRQRFIDSGWGTPAAQQLTGATFSTVWNMAFNPAASFGTYRVIFETTMSGITLTVRLRLHTTSNYNISTFAPVANSGAGTSSNGSTFTISNVFPLITYSIPNTIQITGIAFVQSPTTFLGFLGVAYPTKQSWYDENQYAFAMLPRHNNVSEFNSPSPNLLAASGTAITTNRCKIEGFEGRNPINNIVQNVKAPFVVYHLYGICGQFNEDIAICNNAGLTIGDINVVTPGVEEWWNMYCGNNGIAFRSI